MKNKRSPHLSSVRRVVVKIGSSLLTDKDKRCIQSGFLRQLSRQIRSLQGRGIQCVIVTSGAIAAGLFKLGLKKRPKEMSELQALAAIGQSNLMHEYEAAFNRSRLKVAQILLTREDLSDRRRYSNAHNTLMRLFGHKIIPVVNENDTVAVEEIKFGDNDTLGVLVAHLSEADLLVILTDTEGFYSEDPRTNPKAKLLSDVLEWDGRLAQSATTSKSLVGTGGMVTKIKAAKSMMQSGTPMVIANGRKKNVLLKILDSEPIGTFFHPSVHKMNSRKKWLAWSVEPKGEMMVDDGAKRAILEKNKSLLPTGVRKVWGEWAKGDIVKIVDLDRKEVAKGISNFSSREIDQIKGLRTSEIFQKLGYKTPDEVIHQDNMARID